VAKLKATVADTLSVGLHDPGLTPMLRAGLGGLAASIRAIAIAADPRFQWPGPVAIGPGQAVVEPARVVLRWGGDPEATLRALFEGSFRIREGLVDLPGTYRPERWSLALAAALQTAYKRTFLQHGKTTTKDGQPRPGHVEIDDRPITVTYQPYAAFAHQQAYADVVKGLRVGTVALAGWANPGAVDRHLAFSDTDWAYTPAEALCGLFAIVGCLSFQVTQSGGAGALVILEPSDLVRFAYRRPALSPERVADAYVAGASDAALSVSVSLRMDAARDRAVAATHGVTLRPTPWAKQQKSRVATASLGHVPEAVLDIYDAAMKTLPTRIVTKRVDEDDGDDGEEGYFAAASALRGFAAENLANGRRWFSSFATATTSEKQPRFLHRYRTIKDKLGALRIEDKKGLIEMTNRLDEAEAHLVRAVHVALRQRFGAIADETKGMAAQTRKNRFQGERDKWRLAFAGAKTHEQIRGALADLWARAGSNVELKTHWEELLPLLRAERWQTARDLALVALASYHGGGPREEDDAEDADAEKTTASAAS
jgi:CRISPR-associated protein Cas8a1/Csx13